MQLNQAIDRARSTDFTQMTGHLSREERIAIIGRTLFFAAVAVAAFSGFLTPGGLRLKPIIISIFLILLTTGSMLILTSIYKFVRLAVHLLDTTVLIFLVLRTGGGDSPFLYLLPLTVIPAGTLMALEYGAIAAMALAVFTMYQLMEKAVGEIFVYLFWGAYYAFSATLMAAFLAGRLARKNRIMYVEAGKQNIAFEKRVNRLEKDLSEQKITDELTGLNNFRHFRNRIQEEIHRAERYRYKFSVLAIGIDKLDEFETRNGPAEKDRIIVRVSQQLRKTVRDTDQFARYTNEQFMVLLVSSDSKQSIIPARRIAAGISLVKAGPKKEMTFPASFGIACYPDDAEDVNSLLGMAVAALEKSRERGFGKITLATALYKKIIPG